MMIVIGIIALVGVFLGWRGMRGVRRGAEPRCRRCDYNLVGQIEPRCPECGLAFSAASVARGKRRGSVWRTVAGGLCLALAGAMSLPDMRTRLEQTWRRDGIHYWPNSVLIRRVRTNDPANFGATVNELCLRMQSGFLSREEMAAAADPLITAFINSPRDTYFRSRLEEMVGELLKAGILSSEQKQRFLGVAPPVSPPREVSGPKSH